jgi:hypothetical protein
MKKLNNRDIHLATGLFEKWHGNSLWIKVKNLPILYCYGNAGGRPRWWIMFKDNNRVVHKHDLKLLNEAEDLNYPSENIKKYNASASSSSDGGYIDLPTDDVLNEFPEEIQTAFLFHLDLIQ